MFDIKIIRDHPDQFDAGLARRGVAPMAKEILELDRQARKLTERLNDLQSRRNAASKQIGAAKAKGDDEAFNALRDEVDAIKAEMPGLETAQKEKQAALRTVLSGLPNIPADDVPDGLEEADNLELRKIGEPKLIKGAKEHFDIGEALGQMDFETAAKMSGSRFVLLKGQLARLERAIANFMVDLHTSEYGYTECQVPLLVKDNALYGTGQLPKFEDDLFKTDAVDVGSALKFGAEKAYKNVLPEIIHLLKGSASLADLPVEDLALIEKRFAEEAERLQLEYTDEKIRDEFKLAHYLIPTAEVPLTNIVNGEILAEEELPLRFTAWTPCFRSEAGSAGRDTRGMIRLHQFSKVELVSIATPDQSDAEHERMTACAEEVLKRLGLAFRTMVLCTGDMGFGARKTYDIEVWLPGQQQYREISSCSNCGDFQGRRMKTRYRPKGEKQTQFVHTLNGSALAVGRTMVAILENYQQADGSVVVPEVLRAYMGGLEKIEAV